MMATGTLLAIMFAATGKKPIGDQRSRTAAGAGLFQNRFQAINEIVTLLVVIEDFAVLDYTRSVTVHRIAKSDAL